MDLGRLRLAHRCNHRADQWFQHADGLTAQAASRSSLWPTRHLLCQRRQVYAAVVTLAFAGGTVSVFNIPSPNRPVLSFAGDAGSTMLGFRWLASR
jgi:hypothetical protein